MQIPIIKATATIINMDIAVKKKKKHLSVIYGPIKIHPKLSHVKQLITKTINTNDG